MSHLSNRVDWCFRKALREIDQCKRQGKKDTHRGVLKVAPNFSFAKRHIKKAEHNLLGIIKFREIGYSDWSVCIAFYSMYHCFLAICYKFGYESKNQVCTVAIVERLCQKGLISLDDKYVNLLKESNFQESSALELREKYNYGMDTRADVRIIDTLRNSAKELLYLTKHIVYD